MTQVRAYLAMSLDGFVAGPDDDLAWLDRPGDQTPIATDPWAATDTDQPLDFEPFLDQVGAILMGRRTYDIAAGFDAWAYRDIPMLVATHRDLPDARPSVTAVDGSLADLIAQARARAGDKDVYIDGAMMVREALEQRLLDHLIITLMPTVLGAGVPLFAGSTRATELTVERVVRYGTGLVQLHLRPPA
ncbi:dihydrofolate reductase family protein [Demequina gelatinilytica]|uniref:dihydrofolate reductase family protein n=1 Tax=Demequina gelatinilytica TaxID=1638980 RepID=UPI0009E48000|nr:dihydrofolate reductase family protein [Demequina gelatinilytica]